MPGQKPGTIPSGCPLLIAVVLFAIAAVRKAARR